jgi:hypothetical protein
MASSPSRMRVRVDRLMRRCSTFKVGYATRAEALDACEAGMLAGRVSPGCHLMPYACDLCSQWHMRNVQVVGLPPEDVAKRDYRRRKEDPR